MTFCKGSGGRPRGVGNSLWVLRYSWIAERAGCGVAAVRNYASRGDFDKRDMESVLRWLNGRRRRMGMILVGEPE